MFVRKCENNLIYTYIYFVFVNINRAFRPVQGNILQTRYETRKNRIRKPE